MTRNYFAKPTQIAVSANNKETAVNTEQTLDTLMLVDFANLPDVQPQRQDNEDEMSGYEEANRIDDLGDLSAMTFSVNKLQAQHAGFLLAYCLGSGTATATSSTYTHKAVPMTDMTPPTFTMGVRYGGNVKKARFASMAVDKLTMSIAMDGFATMSADLKGTGKHTLDISEESVSANGKATTLDLSAKPLDGLSENVHEVRAQLSGSAWYSTTCTDASSATITVTQIAAAASGTVDWKVLYRTSGSWTTFPGAVEETRLRIVDLSITAGANLTISGNSVTASGGWTISDELKSLEWTYENNLEVAQTAGSTGDYANFVERGQRRQSITLVRRFKDGVMKNRLHQNETFTLRAKLESKSAFSGTHKYTVDLLWPLVQVTNSTIGNDNGKLTETVTLKVLEDATYGSLVTYVKNAVASYAA